LRDRVAKAALGGGEKARDKHTARGKLLPANASNACSIPARPFWKSGNWRRAACMTMPCPARA
jgi:hypothetical protein